MRTAWITDLRHFLDDGGRIPPDLPPVPRYIGSIAAAASVLDAGRIRALDLPCRRRPGRRPCPGRVHAAIEPETREIDWECPACGDHGVIYNWEGSPWDRRGLPGEQEELPEEPDEPLPDEAPGFSPRARAAWSRIPPEVRIRVLNNVWCGGCRGGTSIALSEASVSGGCLVLRGLCTRCGGPVARLLEDACPP